MDWISEIHDRDVSRLNIDLVKKVDKVFEIVNHIRTIKGDRQETFKFENLGVKDLEHFFGKIISKKLVDKFGKLNLIIYNNSISPVSAKGTIDLNKRVDFVFLNKDNHLIFDNLGHAKEGKYKDFIQIFSPKSKMTKEVENIKEQELENERHNIIIKFVKNVNNFISDMYNKGKITLPNQFLTAVENTIKELNEIDDFLQIGRSRKYKIAILVLSLIIIGTSISTIVSIIVAILKK